MSSAGGIPLAELAKAPLSPCRLDSCIDDPQAELLVAFRENNLRSFVDILADSAVEVNKEYPEENFKTILYLSVEQDRLPFAKELLRRKDVNPNLPNKVLKKFPLHVAVEKGFDELTTLLLLCGADVNAKMENGNTALHLAALRSAANWVGDGDRETVQGRFLRIVNSLLAENNVNFDSENNLECTPLFYAAEKGSQEVAKALLRKGACVTVEVDDESVEDLMRKRMPDVLDRHVTANNRKRNDSAESRLFKALYSEQAEPGRFVKVVEEEGGGKGIDFNADDGGYTLLQYCCDMGYHQLVELLLDKGADPNHVGANNKIPPVVWAAHHGYYRVIKVFKKKFVNDKIMVDFSATDNNVKKENVLHKVLRQESKAYVNREHRDYAECLKLLLVDENPAFRNNIGAAVNAQDNLGNTPLHVAAQAGNHEAVRKLLRSEANIGVKNLQGLTPIGYIAPTIMEEYLDECIEDEGLSTCDKFKLTFRYTFLGPPAMRGHGIDEQKLMRGDGEEASDWADGRPLPETEPLWYMSRIKEHRHLLTHPTIMSFLWMKWRRIRPYFYINVVFYLTFVAFLTSFILLYNTDIDKLAGKGPSGEVGGSTATDVMSWATLGLLVCLALRELFQMFVSIRRYFFNEENLMELVMIALTFVLLLCPLDSIVVKQLSGIVILLSWVEGVLLVGRHPRLSTYINMFTTVSRNFLGFLMWYASFIVAYGLCFYIIFHAPEGVTNEDGEAVNDYYSTPSRALLKTFIMSLTGEMEFEGIEFTTHVGRLIFVFYVFFILLVLVNLLNGLAVSDISSIRKQSEICSCVSRVELITYIESVLLGDPFQFLANFPETRLAKSIPSCELIGSVYKFGWVKMCLAFFGNCKFLLFSQLLRNKTAVFYPNISPVEQTSRQHKRGELHLTETILEDAKSLCVRRQTITEQEEIKQKINDIDKSLLLLAKQQNYVISVLNSIKSS